MSALSLEELTRRLRAGASETSIDALLNALPVARARHLRLCCIPHTFDEVVLRVLEPALSEAEAIESCEALTALAPVGTRDEAFAVHDAARRLVFEQWLEEDRRAEFRAASQRLVDHFGAPDEPPLRNTDETRRNHVFHLLGTSVERGFAEFRRMFIRARDTHDLPACEQLLTLVHEYDRILPPLVALELRYHEGALAVELREGERALSLLESVIAAQDVPKLLMARALNRRGKLYSDQRTWSRAHDEYSRALQIVSSIDEPEDLKYRLLHDLGVVEREQGNTTVAEDHFRSALELAVAAHDQRYSAVASNSLGVLQQRLFRWADAASSFAQSIEVLERLGDAHSIAQVYNNLAVVHLDFGSLVEAQSFAERGLEAARGVNASRSEGRLLSTLARVHQASGDLSSARKLATEACGALERLRDPLGAALAKRQVARIYKAQGLTHLSRQAYLEAIGMLEPLEPREAAAAREECANLDRGSWSLPWYAWCALALCGLVFAAIVIAAIA